MTYERVVFDSCEGNGLKIVGHIYRTSVESRGSVQICHGMSEYIGRYEEMIEFLTSRGWNVFGMDMLGHGESYLENDKDRYPLGFFGDSLESYRSILMDEIKMLSIAKEKLGDGDYYLYGHSMGSIIARNIYSSLETANNYCAFVFSSTTGPFPKIAVKFGILLCGILGNKNRPGKLVNKIVFGNYNRRIKKPDTNYDWLSDDKAEVKEYAEDPLCGFLFTTKGFRDLFMLEYSLIGINSDKVSKKRCFLPYGDEDPVGDYGRGVKKVYSKLIEGGSDATIKCYGPYRHELQRSSVRKQYFEDIDRFLRGENI